MCYGLITWDEDYMWSLACGTRIGPPIDPIRHFNEYARDATGVLIKKAVA